eukprot:scaffold508060_cov33-Prasinocladus_malaysianus.AAC.1
MIAESSEYVSIGLDVVKLLETTASSPAPIAHPDPRGFNLTLTVIGEEHPAKPLGDNTGTVDTSDGNTYVEVKLSVLGNGSINAKSGPDGFAVLDSDSSAALINLGVELLDAANDLAK